MNLHAAPIPSELSVWSALKFRDLIVLISSIYIPVTNAIVPPETPGTTSAAPIARPFMYNSRLSVNFSIGNPVEISAGKPT